MAALEIAFITLRQMIVMFLLMLVGYWLFKKKYVNDEGAKQLSGVLTTVVIPGTVISSLQQPFDTSMLRGILWCICLSALAVLVAVALGILLLPKSIDKNLETAALAFTNSGFIGLPVVGAALGGKSLVYISVIMLMTTLLLFSVGRFILSGWDKSKVNLVSLVKTPGFLGPMLGMALYLGNITLPAIPARTLQFVAAANTPLAMLVLGAFMAQTDVVGMFRNLRGYYVAFLRLIVSVGAVLLLMRALPIGDRALALTMAIALSCSSAVSISIIGREFGANYKYATQLTVLTTILSVATLPLMVAAAGWLFPV